MRFRMFCIVLLLAPLCACYSSFTKGHTQFRVTSLKPGGEARPMRQKLYVAMPHDATKEPEAVKDSIPQTRQALQAALVRVPGEKLYASQRESLPEGLSNAKTAGCAYLLWTEILDWHDPPASFQIASDRGEITLSVYDALTGDLVQSDNLSCNGSATTVNLIGSYSPKDCLKPALDAWVAKNI